MSDFDKDINVPINDCISRKAAIDAVSKGCQEWRGIFGRCEENILALPSAQLEIVQCEDCKYSESIFQNRKLWCEIHKKCRAINYFCADGKRREE